MIFLFLGFLTFGDCQVAKCMKLALDPELIQNSSEKSFCWSRPDFRKWTQSNLIQRDVPLILIRDPMYYFQPVSQKTFKGEIYKPGTFMPLYVKMNGNDVVSPLVDYDIEFLRTGSIVIVRMTKFITNGPVENIPACKLPPSSFTCADWSESAKLATPPKWQETIHKCIPTEANNLPATNSDTILAIDLILKPNKPGCITTPCYKVLTVSKDGQKKTKTIKYSSRRKEWRVVSIDQGQRSVELRKKDKKAVPCPFDNEKWD